MPWKKRKIIVRHQSPITSVVSGLQQTAAIKRLDMLMSPSLQTLLLAIRMAHLALTQTTMTQSLVLMLERHSLQSTLGRMRHSLLVTSLTSPQRPSLYSLLDKRSVVETLNSLLMLLPMTCLLVVSLAPKTLLSNTSMPQATIC